MTQDPADDEPMGVETISYGGMARTNVRLFPEVVAMLRGLCAKTGDSQNMIINDALRAYCAGRGADIKEGMAILRRRAAAEAQLVDDNLARM